MINLVNSPSEHIQGYMINLVNSPSQSIYGSNTVIDFYSTNNQLDTELYP